MGEEKVWVQGRGGECTYDRKEQGWKGVVIPWREKMGAFPHACITLLETAWGEIPLVIVYKMFE